KVRGGLAREALSYVLQGEPSSVLAQLGQGHAAANALRNYGRNRDNAIKALYAPFEELPGAVILRWALLLDVVWSSRKHSFVCATGIHWPEALLGHASGRLVGYYSPGQSIPQGLSCAAIERALEAAGLPAAAFITASFASPVGAGHYGRGM